MEAEKIKISPYDSPWEVASAIINAKYKCENIFGQTIERPFFEPDDLRRIGERKGIERKKNISMKLGS